MRMSTNPTGQYLMFVCFHCAICYLQGKISRVLAAKTALAIRVDAMGEVTDTTLGMESRAKVRTYTLI